jgi:hypothetical protein
MGRLYPPGPTIRNKSDKDLVIDRDGLPFIEFSGALKHRRSSSSARWKVAKAVLVTADTVASLTLPSFYCFNAFCSRHLRIAWKLSKK